MPPTRAIIFDLDDTLFPERQYAFSGFDAVAQAFADRLGPADRSAARMRDLFDTPHRGRVFNVIVQELQLPDIDGLVKHMIATFRTHRPNIALYPDADAALGRLHARYKLGLITDGHSVAQHAKIDALNLRPQLDVIIVTDDLGREFWKPHPHPFELMSQRLGLPHEACTYVADNLAKDFIAPNALGWDTVYIQRRDAVHIDSVVVDGGAPRRTVASLEQLE